MSILNRFSLFRQTSSHTVLYTAFRGRPRHIEATSDLQRGPLCVPDAACEVDGAAQLDKQLRHAQQLCLWFWNNRLWWHLGHLLSIHQQNLKWKRIFVYEKSNRSSETVIYTLSCYIIIQTRKGGLGVPKRPSTPRYRWRRGVINWILGHPFIFYFKTTKMFLLDPRYPRMVGFFASVSLQRRG